MSAPSRQRPNRSTEAERAEYVIVSDVHMTEVVASSDEGWWEYKSPHARQDGALVTFLDALDRRRPAAFERTDVIFNGDTFDFDSVHSAPAELSDENKGWGLPFTVLGSVYKMRRLVADHEVFVHGLARFLARGNRVTFVMGNHDRELSFEAVQEVLREALAAVAPVGTGERVVAAVAFEPWFVYQPGMFWAEHGQQYDATCSYRDVLQPTVPAERLEPEELDASFGSVLARRLLSRMGTFNPFNDESFVLSLTGYFRHWARYYFPRKPFFTVYFSAVFGSFFELRRRRRRALARPPDPDAYAAYAQAKGVPGNVLGMLLRLTSRPLPDQLGPFIHELWVDRWAFILFALLAMIGSLAAITSWTQALLLIVLLPLFSFILRTMGRGSLALQERGRWGLVAEQIASHLGVPVVAFGHSHRPERRPLAGGGRYYNLGSWAPVLEADRESTLGRARRFLIVRRVGPRGRVHVVFQRWSGGETTRF